MVRNGYIDGRDYYFESTIRYRCDNNYRLKGPDRRYCNENGTWEGDPPICEGNITSKRYTKKSIHEIIHMKYFPMFIIVVFRDHM
jgi:hypothetical protein